MLATQFMEFTFRTQNYRHHIIHVVAFVKVALRPLNTQSNISKIINIPPLELLISTIHGPILKLAPMQLKD
jgi:hypothetical protein